MVEAYVASARAPVGHYSLPGSSPSLHAPSLHGFGGASPGSSRHLGRQPSASSLAGVTNAAATTVTVASARKPPTALPVASPQHGAAQAGQQHSSASMEQFQVQLQRAEAREAQLLEELRCATETNQELQDAVDSLRHAQFGALQGAIDAGDGVVPIAAAEAARAAGQDALAYAYEQVQVTEMRATALSRDLEAARSAAESAAKTAAGLKAENQRLSAQAQALQMERQQFQDQVQRDATARGKEETTRRREEEAISVRAEKAEQRAERLSARVEELAGELKEAQKQLKASGAATAKADSEKKALSLRATDAEAKAVRLEEEQRSLTSQIGDRERVLREAQSQAKNEKHELSRRAAEAEARLAQTAKAAADADGERSMLAQQVAEQEVRLTRAAQEAAEVASERLALAQRATTAEAEKDVLVKRATDAEARLARLSQTATEADGEKGLLTRRLAEAEAKAAKAEEEKNSLQVRLSQSARANAEATSEVGHWQEKLADVQAMARKLQEENESLQKRLLQSSEALAQAQASPAPLEVAEEGKQQPEVTVVTTEDVGEVTTQKLTQDNQEVMQMPTPRMGMQRRQASKDSEDSSALKRFELESSDSFKFKDPRTKKMSPKELQALQKRLQASNLRAKAQEGNVRGPPRLDSTASMPVSCADSEGVIVATLADGGSQGASTPLHAIAPAGASSPANFVASAASLGSPQVPAVLGSSISASPEVRLRGPAPKRNSLSQASTAHNTPAQSSRETMPPQGLSSAASARSGPPPVVAAGGMTLAAAAAVAPPQVVASPISARSPSDARGQAALGGRRAASPIRVQASLGSPLRPA